jgi:hypothetical protein
MSLLSDTAQRREQLKNLTALLMPLLEYRNKSASSGGGGGQTEPERAEAHMSRKEYLKALRGLSERDMNDLYAMAQGAQAVEEDQLVLLDQLLLLFSSILY